MILAISASAKRLSVALGMPTVRDGHTAPNTVASTVANTANVLPDTALWAFESRGLHSRDLPYAIQNMPIPLQDVCGIVVDIGPGSFMSVRLAVSFAEGLALARHLPILPVDSLAAVFYGALLDDADGAKNDIEGDTITVQLPARGNDYYTGVWRRKAGADSQDIDKANVHHPSAWRCTAPPFLSGEPIAGAITAFPSAISLLHLAARDDAAWRRAPFRLTPCYVQDDVATPPK